MTGVRSKTQRPRLPSAGCDVRTRVRDHDPLLGNLDGEGERRLDVRLVEAREDAVGVEGLELRVGVAALVDGVDGAVQAGARARVLARRAARRARCVASRSASAMRPSGVVVDVERRVR